LINSIPTVKELLESMMEEANGQLDKVIQNLAAVHLK
jgi:hypothetical protein